jgi:uncharacterized protein (TIGR02271 family)
MRRISVLASGALVGALLLALMNEIWNWGSHPVSVIVIGVVAGIGVVSGYYLLLSKNTPIAEADKPVQATSGDLILMKLREEQLSINKMRVRTADVEVHRESVTDEETLTVPVIREELVVTKDGVETMRIPIRKERVEIRKIPVVLQDVRVYTQQVEAVETVEEMLRKETARIEVTGEADIWEKNPERL